LNAKAAIFAIKKIFQGCKKRIIADNDQRNNNRCQRQNFKRTNTGSILQFSGTCKTIKHRFELRTWCKEMRPHIEELSQIALVMFLPIPMQACQMHG
jgi:hypothetical protein